MPGVADPEGEAGEDADIGSSVMEDCEERSKAMEPGRGDGTRQQTDAHTSLTVWF